MSLKCDIKRTRIITCPKSSVKSKIENLLLHKLNFTLAQKEEDHLSKLSDLMIDHVDNQKRKRDIGSYFQKQFTNSKRKSSNSISKDDEEGNLIELAV